MANELANFLSKMISRMDSIESEVKALKESQKSLYDLPGFKHPYIGVIPLAITASTATVRGNFTISTSGPFVVTGMAAFWRETTQALFRPISSLTEADDATPEVNAIDFEWAVSTGGAGWRWQSDSIPSALLFSNIDRPWYQSVEYVVKGNESLAVEITPISTPNAAGTLYFCFLGYKIMSVDAFDNMGRGLPSVETIPGLRLPYTAVIDIATTNTTAQITGRYTHSTTGLFVVTNMSAAYRETTQGKYRPISSLPDNVVASPVVNAIDFLWSIRTSGNDLFWQSDRVPSPLLFTNRERPFYLPAPAQIPPNSTVTFVADPIAAPASSAGTLHVMLNGYILTTGGVQQGWQV